MLQILAAARQFCLNCHLNTEGIWLLKYLAPFTLQAFHARIFDYIKSFVFYSVLKFFFFFKPLCVEFEDSSLQKRHYGRRTLVWFQTFESLHTSFFQQFKQVRSLTVVGIKTSQSEICSQDKEWGRCICL